MPVAQSQGHAGKALAIAAAGVVLALGLAFLVAQAASRGDVDIRLGDERFNAGKTEDIIGLIEKGDGLPALFPDLVSRNRNIYVQHLGDDPDEGWVAFGAFDPDDPSCVVEIDRGAKILVNGCDGDVTYPISGEGLRAYPTTVENGRLFVDLNGRSTTTTTAGG
jgi:hypothetical protein